MANMMGMPLEVAQQLVQELYCKYGTTMAGLAATGHSLDFDHWHEHVHGTLDYDRLLHKQPAHHKVLEYLNVQRHIFTNADAKHAANCLTRMGLTDCFQVSTNKCFLFAMLCTNVSTVGTSGRLYVPLCLQQCLHCSTALRTAWQALFPLVALYNPSRLYGALLSIMILSMNIDLSDEHRPGMSNAVPTSLCPSCLIPAEHLVL